MTLRTAWESQYAMWGWLVGMTKAKQFQSKSNVYIVKPIQRAIPSNHYWWIKSGKSTAGFTNAPHSWRLFSLTTGKTTRSLRPDSSSNCCVVTIVYCGKVHLIIDDPQAWSGLANASRLLAFRGDSNSQPQPTNGQLKPRLLLTRVPSLKDLSLATVVGCLRKFASWVSIPIKAVNVVVPKATIGVALTCYITLHWQPTHTSNHHEGKRRHEIYSLKANWGKPHRPNRSIGWPSDEPPGPWRACAVFRGGGCCPRKLADRSWNRDHPANADMPDSAPLAQLACSIKRILEIRGQCSASFQATPKPTSVITKLPIV